MTEKTLEASSGEQKNMRYFLPLEKCFCCHNLLVKVLDSQYPGVPMLSTTGWLQGQVNLLSFRGRSYEYQEFLGRKW